MKIWSILVLLTSIVFWPDRADAEIIDLKTPEIEGLIESDREVYSVDEVLFNTNTGRFTGTVTLRRYWCSALWEAYFVVDVDDTRECTLNDVTIYINTYTGPTWLLAVCHMHPVTGIIKASIQLIVDSMTSSFEDNWEKGFRQQCRRSLHGG